MLLLHPTLVVWLKQAETLGQSLLGYYLIDPPWP
jgi:hypothetical protein